MAPPSDPAFAAVPFTGHTSQKGFTPLGWTGGWLVLAGVAKPIACAVRWYCCFASFLARLPMCLPLALDSLGVCSCWSLEGGATGLGLPNCPGCLPLALVRAMRLAADCLELK